MTHEEVIAEYLVENGYCEVDSYGIPRMKPLPPLQVAWLAREALREAGRSVSMGS